MSILVEVAQRANVSVEGVVRVLTREPVSEAIKDQVLAVLDDLSAEQTRVLQRFALAALHDELPRPGAKPVVDEEPTAAAEAPRALLGPGEEPAEQLPASPPDAAHLAPLSSVLGELADAVRDLRRETDSERRERVDDLAVLIDLISNGWQGIERRLGRIEHQLGQLETPRQPTPTPRVVPLPPEPAAPAPAPPEADAAPGGRRLLPLATAVGLIGAVAVTFVLIEVFAGGSDVPRLVAVTTTAEDATATDAPEASSTTSARTADAPEASSTTSARTADAPEASSTTSARPAAAPTTKGTTSAVLGTSTTEPEPAPETSKFRPARDWAWAPVDDADYYAVQFLRDGKSFYRAFTEVARLTLPESVVFGRGSYRWTVRPGYGGRSANRLGRPVVDSSFTVS